MPFSLKNELQKLADPEKAKFLAGFFKTGKGQYGEGDIFLGINVPLQRRVAKRHPDLTLPELKELLLSRVHEHRLVALLILVEKYKRADLQVKKEIYRFYLENSASVDNWDLVDLSAPNIPGDYLLERDRKILYVLAKSDNLWHRRIAILSTFAFIRQNQFDDTLGISEILLNDTQDLIHKAVGWMLREVGKRDQKRLETFLKRHYKKMPRTMLRYAIERFDEEKRRWYLKT
ncbi:MAG: DNA alkylation repair protein [Nitrospirae bacterium]|nr:DNA alkylation repair protein [Nitrospirota bacterium]